MKFYDVLKENTATQKQALYATPIIQSALGGKVTHGEYLQFLTQAYHHVKHTVPLIMACGSRLPEQQEWLREAMAEYIKEELGHQEWILNDINAMGGDAESVRMGKPSFSTELMVSYAYDTVMRKNPVGFLGMIYVLESTSTELATGAADVLKQTLELPETAFSYLYSHGSLDLEHIAFFEKLVNWLVREEDREAVIHAALAFFALYANIFSSLSSDRQTQLAA